MEQRQLLFRKLLFRLGEKLSRQDMDCLTFICKGTIRASRMEKVISATDLFDALSERGKLSANDLSFLALILNSIGRENLMEDLKRAGFSASSSVFSHSTETELQEFKFLDCLVKIAMDLQSVDVDRLKFVLDSSLGHLSSGRVYSATQLFRILEQRQVLTATNLRPLYDALLEISRKDATVHINKYLQSADLDSYGDSENAVNNGVSEHFIPSPPKMNASTPSSGVASYKGLDNCSLVDTLRSDNSNFGHTSLCIEESSPGDSSPIVSPTGFSGPNRILPFGLDLDVFEEEGLSQEGKLLHSLSIKEGELRYKESEIERLQKEVSEQIKVGERMVEQRAEDRDVYSKSIQDLQTVLAVKTQEVSSLMQELQRYHHQMAAVQASSPITEDEFYIMNNQPHGVCLIFNNHEFHHPYDMEKAHPSRGGAQIDQYNLTQTFKYLRYEVIIKENLTAQEMQDTMWRVAGRDHKQYDSFVCCILTHGETNVVHGADSQEVNFLEFAATMKLCPTLREKPKMFFVQACRGEGEHKGLDVERDSGGSQVQTITATIPQEADFFFGYATPTGNAAYRSKRHGSWYISELCKVFAQYAYSHNLSSMMRKVNHQVSKAYTKEGYKQCPEFVDRLRKEVHFFHFLKGQL